MKIDKTKHFDQAGFSGDFYVSNEDKKGFNALRVSVHGKHPKKKMIDTTRVYFVIDGEGIFTLNETRYNAQKNDLFIVEPGNEYEYEGTMNLFEFNISPNNSFKDQIL